MYKCRFPGKLNFEIRLKIEGKKQVNSTNLGEIAQEDLVHVAAILELSSAAEKP